MQRITYEFVENVFHFNQYHHHHQYIDVPYKVWMCRNFATSAVNMTPNLEFWRESNNYSYRGIKLT